MGGCWKGCRIGFDLGGSDRKCAAVIDGKVVHTEEVPWSPVTQADWTYHHDGIENSLRRAAAHLPRVDAIGGSSAGVYVNNQARIASLFRAIPRPDFNAHVRTLFLDIQKAWNVPFVLMNDGDVTALAGSLSLEDHPVLGMAFGTSLAGGYCGSDGGLTSWLNELAFVPIDFRSMGAPQDDWSGDCRHSRPGESRGPVPGSPQRTHERKIPVQLLRRRLGDIQQLVRRLRDHLHRAELPRSPQRRPGLHGGRCNGERCLAQGRHHRELHDCQFVPLVLYLSANEEERLQEASFFT
jgi:hypothetical protein